MKKIACDVPEDLGEENYLSKMKAEVEPYLKGHEKSGSFESYDETRIFYSLYLVEASKATVVISHGFSEFIEKYNEVIYYFLKSGYSVIIPEHRGHGHSGRKVGDLQKVHLMDFQEYIKDFHMLMEMIVKPMSGKKILFGHSMGGGIAAAYIEQYPKDFDGAILSSPMIKMQTGKYPQVFAKLIADFHKICGKSEKYAAGEKGFEAKPSYETSSCVSKARYTYFFEKRINNKHYQTWGASYAWVSAAIKGCAKLRKKRERSKICIPLLIVMAENDHLVELKAIKEFAKGINRCKLLVVEAAKHEVFNADVAERKLFYQEVFAFISQLCCETGKECSYTKYDMRGNAWEITEEEREKNEGQVNKIGKVLGAI